MGRWRRQSAEGCCAEVAESTSATFVQTMPPSDLSHLSCDHNLDLGYQEGAGVVGGAAEAAGGCGGGDARQRRIVETIRGLRSSGRVDACAGVLLPLLLTGNSETCGDQGRDRLAPLCIALEMLSSAWHAGFPAAGCQPGLGGATLCGVAADDGAALPCLSVPHPPLPPPPQALTAQPSAVGADTGAPGLQLAVAVAASVYFLQQERRLGLGAPPPPPPPQRSPPAPASASHALPTGLAHAFGWHRGAGCCGLTPCCTGLLRAILHTRCPILVHVTGCVSNTCQAEWSHTMY